MIYAFGDSFTYGYNFKKKNREHSIWPYFFSNELNLPYTNMSAPGGSNWRIARQIHNLNIQEKDVIIIGWTIPSRFEFGVSKNYEQPLIKNDLEGDLIEEHKEYKVKRFFQQLSERTNDPNAKIFNTLAYTVYYNEKWFEEMFKIIFSSCVHILKNKKCNWLMFNTWTNQFSSKDPLFDVPQYIFSTSDINFKIKNQHNLNYWNVEEHKKVASVLFDSYKTLYLQ